MSQGVFPRFKFKKALKEALAADPSRVRLEATSFYGNEYDGPVDEAPKGRYNIAGPDPHRERNWYATIEVSEKGIKVA